MNPRSDVDFSSPKVDLMVHLSEVAIELNRPQVSLCVVYKLVYVKGKACFKKTFFRGEKGREIERS